MALQWPLSWGFAGAFIFAAPQLTVCSFAAQQACGHWVQCAFQFAIALMIGAIAASALEPWLTGSFLHSNDQALARIIAATIGLLANPIAPRLIDVLSVRVLQILKGQSK